MADKPHIKQREFEDRNITGLDQHARKGKKLAPPFANLPISLTMSSWKDLCIPNIMWACITVSEMEREDYLQLFRDILKGGRDVFLGKQASQITHNHLSALSYEEFSRVLSPLFKGAALPEMLSPLLLLETLPDRAHWERCLPAPDPSKSWDILARAIISCLDHQSQASTDIRWLKVMHVALAGRMRLPEEQVEELRLYPTRGDMRRVRPFIRATEMAIRQLEFGDPKEKIAAGVPESAHDAFWKECYSKTQCILADNFRPPKADSGKVTEEVVRVSLEVSDHFHDSMDDTGLDPRHDGAFGLVLYALHILIEIAHGRNEFLVSGRVLLRSIVELFIALRFLTSRDSATLWAQYRSYGTGQAKLAFLKNLREESIPAFIDLENLEILINEDMWLEFQNINLGSWAESNLRKMSEDAKCKDVYDKHYDLLSGYAHGHWICVRNTVYQTCMNPLHRLHRIPSPAPVNPSVLADGCKLVNRMLDDLNHLYPTIKIRLSAYKVPEERGAGSESELR